MPYPDDDHDDHYVSGGLARIVYVCAFLTVACTALYLLW